MTKSTQPRIVNTHLPVFGDLFGTSARRSPFAGNWLHYELDSPIDFSWGLLARLDRVWSADREFNGLSISEPWAAFHLGAFLQIVMNHGNACASDYREPPRVIALPDAHNDGFMIHGFVWKDDNNGNTYMVLKQQSADALMTLIDPTGSNMHDEPTLLCFDDGEAKRQRYAHPF